MVDFLDELTADDNNSKDGTETLPTRDDVDALRAEIEALNKEKHGLLKGVKEERSKRQEISGRLNQLTDTVQGILSQRQQQAAELENVGNQANSKLPVTWTEDGEGYVNREQIEDILSPYEQKIANLEQQLQNSTATSAAEREAQRVKEAIVGEDERYEPAYRKYQAARKWVTEQVADFVNSNNVGRPLTSGEALDYVFNKDLEGEFETAYPGMNLEDIVVAEDSKRLFRRAMSSVASAMEPKENPNAKIDDRFQKVLKKPSSLGNQANAKAGNLSVVDKVSSLGHEDFENMTDAQAEALLAAIASEEKSDGVTF
jgi:hypothetical protein